MTLTRTKSTRRRLRGRQVLLTGVALLGATAYVGAQQDAPAQAAGTSYVQGPVGLSFYQPPASLPAVNGSMIWARESSFPTKPGVSAKAWQMLYKSTSATSTPIAVSGTVLIPNNVYKGAGPRPIIAWSPGSKGIGDACTSSRNMPQGGDYEVPFILDVLAKGYAVVMTDYQGMGTPGDHPYAVGPALGRSVLDSIRAAHRLTEAGLSTSAPIGIFGYSEGGLGANWAARLAHTYAPTDILPRIKGVAAGGTPNDLFATARFVDGGPVGGLQALAAVGYQAAYPELKFEDKYDATGIFKLENNLASNHGNAVARTVKNNCLVGALTQTAFTKRSSLTENGVEVLNIPAWKARFEENKLNSYTPTVPMFMWHGEWDEAVPFAQAKHLRNNFCDNGAKVFWREYPGLEHLGGIFPAIPSALSFFQERFDNKPFTSANCADYRY